MTALIAYTHGLCALVFMTLKSTAFNLSNIGKTAVQMVHSERQTDRKLFSFTYKTSTYVYLPYSKL